MLDLKHFCHTNSFRSMLLDTKKYRELYNTNEAKVALCCAIFFTVDVYFLSLSATFSEMVDVLQNILGILISGMIGLLGFLVTGLAMMASIITQKAVRKIDSDGKTKSLAGILFSFYFEGAMVGLNVFLMTFFYIFLAFIVSIRLQTFIFAILGIAYVFSFTVLYAVTLLGSCINFFFVNVYYDNQ